MTVRRRTLTAVILACGIGLAACFDQATDPRRVFDFEDASSDLRPQVEEAIASANAALGMANQFVLRATWQEPVSKGGPQEVPVYLLRRRLPIHQTVEGIALAQAAVGKFRSALATVTVDPRYEDCKDIDPCAPLMYAGTEIARLASGVVHNFSAVDSAATESDCRCVILMEEDLKKFELIIGPSIDDGKPIVPLTWYIPWYALHEVGHLNKAFRLQPSPAWAALYERTHSGLNEK
ncbi:hypothetical protein ABNQ39_36800 (plasmid) [Azospirillum sp. A26]|uniref:hypothetical protein n=1 Tax=Azospirillum sp. A26 TaxID=3160607 RepID=UPI00367144DD